MNPIDIADGKHRAAADEGAFAVPTGQTADRLQWLRRIKRDLDRFDAFVDQGSGNRLNLIRLDPPQNRNDRTTKARPFNQCSVPISAGRQEADHGGLHPRSRSS